METLSSSFASDSLATTARNSARVKLPCLPSLYQSTDILKAKGVQDVFNLSQKPSSHFNQFVHVHQNTWHTSPVLYAQNLNTIINPSLNKTQVLTLKTNKHVIVSQSLIATLLNTCSFQVSNEQSAMYCCPDLLLQHLLRFVPKLVGK